MKIHTTFSSLDDERPHPCRPLWVRPQMRPGRPGPAVVRPRGSGPGQAEHGRHPGRLRRPWLRRQELQAWSSCDINMAEDPKQVGSSFKPYVLATAVSAGHERADQCADRVLADLDPEGPTLSDRDATLPAPRAGSRRDRRFSPTCRSTRPPRIAGRGSTVANAAAISSDPAFEDLSHCVGVQNVINMAKGLGVGQNPFNYARRERRAPTMNAQFGDHSKLATPGGSVAIALGESEAHLGRAGEHVRHARRRRCLRTCRMWFPRSSSPTGPIPLARRPRPGCSARTTPPTWTTPCPSTTFRAAPPIRRRSGPGRTVIAKTGTHPDRAGRLVHRRDSAVLAGRHAVHQQAGQRQQRRFPDAGHPAADWQQRDGWVRRCLARENLGATS